MYYRGGGPDNTSILHGFTLRYGRFRFWYVQALVCFMRSLQSRTSLRACLAMIAHFLSTVQHAEQIALLRDGSHQELLGRQGYYHSLWQAQLIPPFCISIYIYICRNIGPGALLPRVNDNPGPGGTFFDF